MPTMRVHDELSFIAWLRKQQPRLPAGVLVGIGDDMAVVEQDGGLLAVSSDLLLEGVHFDTNLQSFRAIGHKAMACSLSDCAAMAVKPIGVTVSLALPKRSPWLQIQELYAGLWATAEQFELAIVGGDTTCWTHPLAIDVNIFARPFDGVAPVTRRGAKVGDALFVTGLVGGSRLGRHLSFMPRVREAKLLAESLGSALHAMMDISDGLALDLHRLCQASGVGACLDEGWLCAAIHKDAFEASKQDRRPPLEHALEDGEDFELLLAAPPGVVVEGVTLLPIGIVTESQLTLRRTDGSVEKLEPVGFVHG